MSAMPKTHAGSRARWGAGLLADQLPTQPLIYVLFAFRG